MHNESLLLTIEQVRYICIAKQPVIALNERPAVVALLVVSEVTT